MNRYLGVVHCPSNFSVMYGFVWFKGQWVALDEYYYGTVEGDSNYTEEKGEFRFKVWKCQLCFMLYW